MDSLSKLRKKGITNINKVKRTGKDFATKYNAYKLVSNPFSTSEISLENIEDNDDTRNNNNTFVQENRVLEKDPINYHRNDSHSHSHSHPSHNHKHKHNHVYTRQKSLDTSSQTSLYSEAPTLINSSSTGFSKFPPRKFSYDNSLYSTSTINNLNQQSSSIPSSSSSSSSPTPIFSRAGSVSSTSLFTDQNLLNVKEEKILYFENNKINEYIEKNQNVPKHLLNPSPEVKEAICTYYHPIAFEEGKNQLLNYYQLPFPWRENRYIIENYRFYDSHKKSFLSIINWYGWHNEMSNIWSHLLGALYILYLAIFDFPNSQVFKSDKIPYSAKAIVYVFIAAALKCLLASVFWHTFNGTSFLKLRRKFACVDYSGITILITASILTTEFVSLYEHTIPMCAYMFISLSLGFIGIFLNCSPKFDCPEARPLRIRFFILLAGMGILAFVHASFLESFSYSTNLLSSVTNKSIVWYLVGVVFYGSFIPERFRTDYVVDDCIPTTFQLSTDLDIITKDEPIHFREKPTCHHRPRKGILSLWWVDYFGCSHTFWHIFVVLGVIGHYKAIIDMFTKRWLMS